MPAYATLLDQDFFYKFYLMTYTNEQIELFDKVFEYFINFYIYKTQTVSITDSFLSKKLNIDKSLAQFAINEICTIGHNLNILTATKYGYGDFEIVNMEKVKSLTFKSQGGFKKYFANKDIDKKLLVNQNVYVGTNYGHVNTGHQSSFSNLENIFSTKKPDTAPQNKANNSELEIKGSKVTKVLKYIGDNFIKLLISVLGGIIVFILTIKFGFRK